MKIMAPAGDSERLEAAIKAGADEVYMGVAGFGARRFAKNFSVDEYAAAIDRAHRAGVSVHLTFNTVLSDAELDLVYPDIKRLYEAGLDEAIVQDLGAAQWLRSNFPELRLCASTQLSPANGVECSWYEKHGFTRAVLARELSLDEIRSIRNKTKIELEVFVSGALCLGCSGKCYLSSFIGGRSGNRGMCAQPCRQYYRAETLEGNRAVPGVGEYGYFLSLRDQLQGLDEIKQLVDIGIDSVKIEGRMKSPTYVYEVVRYYRDIVDAVLGISPSVREKSLSMKASAAESPMPAGMRAPAQRRGVGAGPAGFAASRQGGVGCEEARRDDVAAIFNRGYDRGYFHDHDPAIINEYFSSNFGVEIGRVRRDSVRLSKSIRNGDGVVFLDETARKLGGLNVSGIRTVDPTSSRRTRIVESAEPGDLVQFHEPIPEGAVFLYRTYNYCLNKEIDNALRQTRRRIPVDARLVARVGRPLELSLRAAGVGVTRRAEQDVAPAQKKGVDRESLLASLDRFGETAFYLAQTRLDFDQNAFVPKSLLNQLRQDAAEELEAAVVASYRRVAPERSDAPAPSAAPSAPASPAASAARVEPDAPARPSAPHVHSDASVESVLPYLAATVRTREQFETCQALGVKRIYHETFPVQFEGRFRFRLPGVLSPIAGSLADALRFEALGTPYALDWFFNVANARSVRFLADALPNVRVMYLSPEISDHAIDAVFENLGDYQDRRRLTLGLPVYGRLLAMFTQKTLFEAARTRVTNADDRRLIVERNLLRTSPEDSPALTAAFDPAAPIEPALPETGSSLYLDEPLDLLDAIPWILDSGIGEARLVFTNESASEVRRAVGRACAYNPSGKYKTFSYGYTRDGVF